MDDYIKDFIRESEENITELNNSLLELEDDPDDEEAMDSIFRTAHTLKGNFGAMGFQDASDVAHAIEDLLDEVREGRMDVTPEMMDLVFAGVDEIDRALGQIEETGETDLDVDHVVADIREVLEEGDAGGDDAGDGGGDAGEDDALDGVPLADLDDPGRLAAADGDVFHVAVDMGDPDMKGVDAMFALEGLQEDLDLLGTVPDEDAVEDGEYDDGF